MTHLLSFYRHTLSNGLRLLVHTDPDTPFATINLAYGAGSRDEDPEHTGFAHLFEHLMFEGTPDVPHFDHVVHLAGGESNAFTTNDYTNYYINLPAGGTETAIRLEADRMQHIRLTQSLFDTERNVVIEEYNQRYIGQPYGDARLLLNSLCYKVHPYRWLPIGASTEHLIRAGLHDVTDFYDRFYAPDNAVMAVCGNVRPDQVVAWCEKYFGAIPARHYRRPALPAEPVQTAGRFLEVERDVPASGLFMAFHTAGRLAPGYHAADMLSDALDAGKSTLLYRTLVQERQLFSSISACITGTVDPGLLLVQGLLAEGVSMEAARQGIFDCLHTLTDAPCSQTDMQKFRNWHESSAVMDLIPIQQRAQTLCYNELFGKAEDVNQEIDRYNRVSAAELQNTAQAVFSEANCSTLFFRKAQ